MEMETETKAVKSGVGASAPRVELSLTVDQAYVVRDALDLFNRMGLGQLEEIAALVRTGLVVPRAGASEPRCVATLDQIRTIEDLAQQMKTTMGFDRGGSFGIGHRHVAMSATRAYEIGKALSRELAIHRDPCPPFKSVDYDGLMIRYTGDAAPTARVICG